MTLLRTALVSTLLGVSMSSFAAMPSDPASRDARMDEALQHYRAKQDNTSDAMPQAKMHHAKHHRHAMKHSRAKSQDDNAKAKDQTQ